MEHSKGELTANNNGEGFDMEGMRHIFIKTDKGYFFGRIDGHTDGLSCGKPDISNEEATANANRLVTCWNEHDTLKAKAELLDDFVAYCNEKTPDTPLDKCNLEMTCKINDMVIKYEERSNG